MKRQHTKFTKFASTASAIAIAIALVHVTPDVTPLKSARANDGLVIIDMTKKSGTAQEKRAGWTVSFRSGAHENYDRLVIEAPALSKEKYTIDTRDDKTIIRFQSKGRLSSEQVAFKNLKNVVSIKQLQEDPLEIEITTKDAVVKTSKGTDKIILDFSATKDKAEETDRVASSSKSARSKRPKIQIKTFSNKDQKFKSVPDPIEQEIAQNVTKQEEEISTKVPEVVSQPIEEMIQENVELAYIPTFEENVLPEQKEIILKERSKRMKRLEQIQKKSKKSVQDNLTDVLREGSIVSISSLTPIELAIFKRDDHLWIIQSSKRQGLPPLVDGPVSIKPQLINDVENKVEAWVLPMDRNADYEVTSTEFSWKIRVTDTSLIPKESIPIIYDKVLHRGKEKNAIILDFDQITKGYQFDDPFIGDSFIAFPVNDNKYQLNKSQKFPQFEFLAAKSGIVAKIYSPAIDYFYRGGSLHFTSDQELMVSSPVVALQSNPIAFAKNAPRKEDSFFNVQSWFVTNEHNFGEDRRAMERQIVEAEADDVRLNNILNLAKLYFANGFGHEALGVLHTAKLMDKRLTDNHNFLALEGASLSLADRHSEAFARLYDPRIADYAEMALWRGYAHSRKGNWSEAYQEFKKTGELVSQYPRFLQAKLVPTLIEACLQAGDKVNSHVLMQLLEESKDLHRKELSVLSYFKGRLDMLEGHFDEASDNLRLAANGADRYFRARAAFELLKLQRSQGEISDEKAVDVLERIRFIWRGDELEVSVMEYLSEVYYLQRNYAESLKMLRRILPLISDDQDKTNSINERLSVIFKNLFIKETDKELKPLSALALYDEFSDLTPVGPDGDVAIQKLAERMVSVDLLGRASNLLEHQIKFRLKGEAAARVGARLASIRLLDQTPSFALRALDETSARDLPAQLEEERRLLKARAYSQLNKPDDAIKTLAGLNTEMAHRLNVDVNWQAERWEDAAKAITPLLDYLLKKNKLVNEQGVVKYLDDETSDLILNQSVAYILSGDLGAVKKLFQKYSSVMDDTKNSTLFRLITREPKAGQLADLQTLNDHVAEVDMFRNFLDTYRANLTPQAAEGS